MKLTFTDKDGKEKEVVMGCYGIGPSRMMGSIVEVHHDDKGIIWPKELSPYEAHLLLLDEKKKKAAEKLYQDLTKLGYKILFDDRDESAGTKFMDADLLGISMQLIIGGKTSQGEVEYKMRDGSVKGKVSQSKVEELLRKFYK